MNFQRIILVIAMILLLILLVVIGISLSKAKSSETWPPIIGSCPDYWLDTMGNGESCVNTHNLGICNLPGKNDKNPMNFNVLPFTGSTGNCSKYKWATGCKVSWDGITYGASNPCSTTETLA